MLNERSRVGIAQIIFYIPIVPLAAFVLFRHGSKRPRMAWIPLLTFSLIRLAGGIVTILLQNDPSSVGLIIASLILLGVGVVPLLIATLGLLRIVCAACFEDVQLLHRTVLFLRALFFAAVALLVTGGSFEGSYNSQSSVASGEKLVRAGYIVLSIVLAILIAFQAYLWRIKSRLTTIGITILKGTSSAMPFLIVRITYSLLSVFDSSSLNTKWNTLDGSVAAFVVMTLVMEYIVVTIYLSVGLIIPFSQEYKRRQAGVSSVGQESGLVEGIRSGE